MLTNEAKLTELYVCGKVTTAINTEGLRARNVTKWARDTGIYYTRIF